MPFSDFAALLPAGQTLNPVHAVRVCLAALREHGAKRGILLLVDAVVKLGPQTAALLSVVGTLLDSFTSEELNVACTTLDATAFITPETASGRPLAWAPLPALSQASVERMLCRALRLCMLPRALRVALSDCAGHPSSLEYVMEAAKRLQLADPQGWMAADG
jgi:hypothetical protein